MRLAEKHVVSSDQPRVCVADGAGWPCDTRLALDLVDALLPDRALPPPAAPGLDVAREAMERVKASAIENGGRLTPGAILDIQAAIDALGGSALAETPGEPHE